MNLEPESMPMPMPEPVVLPSPAEMQAYARRAAAAGRSVGFVPTMGALHKGHLSLVERARAENDLVVASVYVNPTQFDNPEDLKKYPRTFDADKALLAKAGTDAIFAPGDGAMYDPDARTWVEVGDLPDRLCGLSRPGHFRGVCTVVTKLLSIVRPDRAYFGLKDYQQFRIVEVLARDLNLGCAIVPCPIVREDDGLACSSRNVRLAPAHRREAVWLNNVLRHAEARILKDGERDALKLAGELYELLERNTSAEIDYLAIVDALHFADLRKIEGEVLIAAAANFGKVRLIDNTRLSV
ncbi:MAG: pantoate--beta-alanine ligase [Planctomycetota bacterium]|nr:pantoate--beta-alanine ligase [Planctomycetota bacterium]